MEKTSLHISGVIIDWCTFVVHDMPFDDVRDLLGLSLSWEDNFKHINGYPRYKSAEHINIRYGCEDPLNYGGDITKTRRDMGICVDMSGQGCRAFEQYSSLSWFDLFGRLVALPAPARVCFTRLDLSYDDFDGFLDVQEISIDALARNFTSPSKKVKVILSDDQKTDVQGATVYVGADSSDCRLRIYDKLAERIANDPNIKTVDDALAVKQEILCWVRVELVLRHDLCRSCIDKLLELRNVGAVLGGLLRNYCCFREPTSDSNKSRWPIASYWEQLLLGVERIRLWHSPGVEYDVIRSVAHMVRQYGQLIVVLSKVNLLGGIEGLVSSCNKAFPLLNKKYQTLVDSLLAAQAEIEKAHEAERAARCHERELSKLARLKVVQDQYSWLLEAGLSQADFDMFCQSFI